MSVDGAFSSARFWVAALVSLLLLGNVCAEPADGVAARDGLATGGAVGRHVALETACTALAKAPWPKQPMARRAQLQRLESARNQCMGNAEFLAALGALWLDEGEPNLALIWLERSLLLDPSNSGAQADHALALAALGQPDAVRSLIIAWADRADVPQSLRLRLESHDPARPSDPLPRVRLGGADAQSDRWEQHREATVLLGHETNLDHSPRLAEITLTLPEGPSTFPIDPLTPRRGAAVLSDFSWQIARSPQPGRVWRLGVQLGARAAPGASQTNWYHHQWAASAAQQWGPWRGQLETMAVWIAGPLTEPYRLLRLNAVGERNALGCNLRLALEAESRTQQHTSTADGRTIGAFWSGLCPISAANDWALGLAVRASIDRPRVVAERPGGTQRQWSAAARLLRASGNGLRIDASLRYVQLRDDEGYIDLLKDGARRSQRQVQASLEISQSLQGLDMLKAAELVIQVQAVRQVSNLSLFQYSGISTYSGLRWAW